MAASVPHDMDVDPMSVNEDVLTETEDNSEEVHGDLPKEAPDDLLEDVPDDVPDDLNEDVPEDIPEGVSEDLNKGVSDDLNEDVSEDLNEDVSDYFNEDVPEKPKHGRTVAEQQLSSRDSSDSDLQDEADGRLLLDSPETQEDPGPPPKRAEDPDAAVLPEDAVTEQDYVELLEQLLEQRDAALSHSRELQAKVPHHIKRNPRNFGGLEAHVSSAEQQQMYEQNLRTLRELKEQLVAGARQAQQQAEELARRCQEKKDKVDAEWRAFLAQKKAVAVPELRRRLGGPAARAKVDSILEEEQQHQEELVRQRLKNIRLNTKIRRLEAALRGWEERRDPVQVQFEQLQATRLEQKKQAEKDKESSVKMQQKIRSSLELLSNMKEKIFLSQTHVQLRREELAQLEAQVSRRRDLLLQTQQACSRLHQDNARLREEWGLLGRRTLLQDLELTVDAAAGMEQRLQELQQRRLEQGRGRGHPK